jgi:hypothetical protein
MRVAPERTEERLKSVTGLPAPLCVSYHLTSGKQQLRRLLAGSEFAFAKAFKRESGTAPGNYRVASAA